MVLFALLLIMCCFAEYLLNKMILTLSVLDKKYTFYHAVCAILRNAWILFGVWSAAVSYTHLDVYKRQPRRHLFCNMFLLFFDIFMLIFRIS